MKSNVPEGFGDELTQLEKQVINKVRDYLIGDSEMSEYKVRDIIGLDKSGNYYGKHVVAMTREELYSKSDIAAELGYRDMVIDTIRQQNAELVELAKVMCEHACPCEYWTREESAAWERMEHIIKGDKDEQ